MEGDGDKEGVSEEMMLLWGLEGMDRSSLARHVRERTSGHWDYTVQGGGVQPRRTPSATASSLVQLWGEMRVWELSLTHSRRQSWRGRRVLIIRAFNIRQKSLCFLLKSLGTTDDSSADLWVFLSPLSVRPDIFERRGHVSSP